MLVLANIRVALGELDNVILLLALLTPIITGLVVTPFAKEWQKGLVSIGVTGLTAAVVKWLQDDAMTWTLFLSAWLQLVIAHLVAWEFLLRRPAAIINEKTPGVIGAAHPDPIMVDASTGVVIATDTAAPVVTDPANGIGATSGQVLTTAPTSDTYPDDDEIYD